MKVLWQLFLSFNRAKQIAISVLLAHFLFVFVLVGQYWFSKKKPVHNRIAVRTFTPERSSTKTSSPVKPAASPKKTAAKPAPAPTPPVKKTGAKASPKIASKKEVPQVLPSKSKTTASEQTLLEEIAKGLENLETGLNTKPKEQHEISIPTLMPKITDSSSQSIEDLTIGETIVSLLQNALQLPEYGDVVAKIEISPRGELISCEILKAESQKNSEFLKTHLSEVRFPILDKSTSFTITFRNSEKF